jgi:synaptic vesicle membrane protein VAT-1
VGWPITPGFEFAGTVAKVGPRVSDVQVGARVFGVTRFDGYATHVAVPRDQIFAMPAGLTAEEAAAFPAVFLTAHYALFDLANVRAGWRILVHSAAGGVGGALLQLAKVAGCTTVGVVGSTAKVEAARRLGATHVIDKSREDLWRMAKRYAPDGYDVVLDANGAATLRESYAHTGSPGRLVIYGLHTMMSKGRGKPSWPKLALDYLRTPRFDPLRLTNDNKSILAFNLSYLFERRSIFTAAIETMTGWLAEGKISPPPTQSFSMDRVADAHRALESGETVGKLVLVP